MTPAILALNFSSQSGSTYMRVTRQDPPWRALRAFSNESGEALVHLHNVSGGILGGDNLRLEVTLAPNVQAQVTTVGATRVHRHREGRPDSHNTAVMRVGNNALLEYLPEPVIPFARSRYAQTCEIHLAEGAGLVCWETLAAGRLAHGESFKFEKFSSRTAIYANGYPVALEHFALSPPSDPMTSPARMGTFLYSATMYICRADTSTHWLSLENQLNELAHSLSGAGAYWGASSLVRHGVAIRGMVREAHQASHGLHTLWQAAKQAVWERGALPPRKIY